MVLAKWKANSEAVVGHLKRKGFESPSLNLTGGEVLKVLGISWKPKEDNFCFVVNSLTALATSRDRVSKRFVLKGT